MPTMPRQKVLSWATDVDDRALDQAARASHMPFVAGHVALMPDAHVGLGATVGSVIPTRGAVMPAAVGVDIGCGMIASRTSLTSHHLGDHLEELLSMLHVRIPAGVGGAHAGGQSVAVFRMLGEPARELTARQQSVAIGQFGTLGAGNHFLEVCLDETDRVWVVVHSGSRGIGNQLAQQHMATAKGLMRQWFIGLDDPDLAYLVEGTEPFDRYINDLRWCQRYAAASREQMMATALEVLFALTGGGYEADRINCHHNFTEQEYTSHGRVWVTRKGAIKAADGDRGVIPGSMGTATYIVRGKGVAASYNSCAHGAGRRMSRTQARAELTVDSLHTAMKGITWKAPAARQLLDEHPDSYKDIDEVMAAQSDLVTVDHVLAQVLNYKGTK